MARRRFFEDTESLGLASRYLREAEGLSLQQVVDGIERQSGVKIWPQDLHYLETGSPSMGEEKITALVKFHGCTTPREMIEKGNAMARQYQVYDSEMLCPASRYLRETAGLTLQQVIDGIERQSGVKISLSTLSQFENGVPRSLKQEKIDALIAFHDCATPQEMIEKGNEAVPPHGRGLGLAERYLRKESGLTQQQVVDGMERQSGVKISRQALQQFESGVPSIGQEKIDALIAFHGCATPQEMIDKANRAAAYLFHDAGKLKSKPAGEALTHTLRRILDQPFHRLEKLAAEREAQENLKERGR